MTVPAAAARYWARGYGGQAAWAVGMSAASGVAGLVLSQRWSVEPGAVMTLCAALLFAVSALGGTCGGLLQTWRARTHLRALKSP
jgi:zinc/manganese transport system permease protein